MCLNHITAPEFQFIPSHGPIRGSPALVVNSRMYFPPRYFFSEVCFAKCVTLSFSCVRFLLVGGAVIIGVCSSWRFFSLGRSELIFFCRIFSSGLDPYFSQSYSPSDEACPPMGHIDTLNRALFLIGGPVIGCLAAIPFLPLPSGPRLPPSPPPPSPLGYPPGPR